MKHVKLLNVLKALGACRGAEKWAGKRFVSKTAWDECPRGDWLLWIASELLLNKNKIKSATIDCAKIVLPRKSKDKEHALRIINLVERYTERHTMDIDLLREEYNSMPPFSVISNRMRLFSDLLYTGYSGCVDLLPTTMVWFSAVNQKKFATIIRKHITWKDIINSKEYQRIVRTFSK